MSRASTVYVAMFVALVVGVWGILRAGAGLRAPHDLSGNWEIEQPVRDDGDAALGPDDGADGVPGEIMSVEQSGRYFRLRFDTGAAIALKLADETVVTGEPGGRHTRLHLTGTAADVRAQSGPNPGLLRVRLAYRGRDWHFDAWSPERVAAAADRKAPAATSPTTGPAVAATAAVRGATATRPATAPDDKHAF